MSSRLVFLHQSEISFAKGPLGTNTIVLCRQMIFLACQLLCIYMQKDNSFAYSPQPVNHFARRPSQQPTLSVSILHHSGSKIQSKLVSCRLFCSSPTITTYHPSNRTITTKGHESGVGVGYLFRCTTGCTGFPAIGECVFEDRGNGKSRRAGGPANCNKKSDCEREGRAWSLGQQEICRKRGGVLICWEFWKARGGDSKHGQKLNGGWSRLRWPFLLMRVVQKSQKDFGLLLPKRV